jgi:segregation and condensation protein B
MLRLVSDNDTMELEKPLVTTDPPADAEARPDAHPRVAGTASRRNKKAAAKQNGTSALVERSIENVNADPADAGRSRDGHSDGENIGAGPAAAGNSGEAAAAEKSGDDSALDRPDGSAIDDDDSESDAGPAVDLRLLEALLLATHHPLTAGRLGELLGIKGARSIRKAIKSLNDEYESTGRSFRVEQLSGGYQILTLPEFGESLKKLHQKEIDAKLTKAALETLAIIAYKQPILRADVEAIRGVACGETIRSLMEKHLVKIAGRAEEPGRPILYGTTKRFMEVFGLNSLKDLPQSDDPLKAKA